MKKFVLCFCLVLPLFLSGCRKEQNTPEINNDESFAVINISNDNDPPERQVVPLPDPRFNGIFYLIPLQNLMHTDDIFVFDGTNKAVYSMGYTLDEFKSLLNEYDISSYYELAVKLRYLIQLSEIELRNSQFRFRRWNDDPEYLIARWSYGLELYRCSRKVIPETVGQYTGLKDKKGVKIFEEDILHFENIVNCLVSFAYGRFGIENLRPYSSLIKKIADYGDCEVIGNIHDNPELLHANNT
jgi:hypothetical protein